MSEYRSKTETEPIDTAATVTVDGARLSCRVQGSGIPALVIGSARYYPRTFSNRLRHSCRMAFMDVRHFAENDTPLEPDKISLDTYIQDIESVRAQLGLDRAVVIGHSHHGNLALEYAKRHPARVSHLVLIGSPPLAVSATLKAAEAYWENHASEKRKSKLRENMVALRCDEPGHMTAEQAYVAQYVAEGPKYWYDINYDASHLWQDVPINMEIVKVFRDFFSGNYEMDWDPMSLTAPILAVAGRYDYAVPPILWDEVRPGRQDFAFHLFEYSGHTPQLEEPDRFDRFLLEWLANTA